MELQEFLDLDAAIATILGIKHRMKGNPPYELQVCTSDLRDVLGGCKQSADETEDGTHWRAWSPSMDANAALAVAAKVGLFRMHHRFLSDGEMGGWSVYEAGGDSLSATDGDTAAEAICKAVAEMHKRGGGE